MYITERKPLTGSTLLFCVHITYCPTINRRSDILSESLSPMTRLSEPNPVSRAKFMGSWLAVTAFILFLLSSGSQTVRHEAVETVVLVQEENGVFSHCMPDLGHPYSEYCRAAIQPIFALQLLTSHKRGGYIWRAAGSRVDTPRKCGRQWAQGEIGPFQVQLQKKAL